MKSRTWLVICALAAAATLALGGCAKNDQSANGGAPSDSLANQNQQAPMAGSADSAAQMSQREQGGQPLPTGTPAGQAAEQKREHAQAPKGGEKRPGGQAGGPGTSQKPGARGTMLATLPGGQSGEMTLTTALSSETSKEGDTFSAELATAWSANNKVILPAGTRVLGHLGYVESAARGKSKAKLVLVYDKLGLSSGETVPIDAKADTFEAEGTTKRDVAVTGAGAVIGGILGKLSGNTKKGVVIGAAAGGAAALGARGKPMDLAAGQKLTLHLQNDVRVPVRKGGA